MAHSTQKKIKFSKGQVSTKLIERTDLDAYNSSAQKMENFVSSVYGGVGSRRGTIYIDDLYNNKIEGTATSSMGGTESYIQDEENEFQTSNIGTNREIFSVDYGRVLAGGYIKLKDLRINSIAKIEEFTSSSTLNIVENREYYIEMVGGGGGGSNNFGGRGAGIKAYINLPIGTYDWVQGQGGSGAGAYVRNNDGFSGTQSTLTGNGLSIVCGGGTGRRGRRNGGTGGNCGTLSYTIPFTNTIKSKTTNGENIGVSFIDGQYRTYGAGGQPQPNDDGAGYRGQNGYSSLSLGYIKIKIQSSVDGQSWEDIETINVTTDGQNITCTKANFRYIRAVIVENSSFDISTFVKFRQFIIYEKTNQISVLKKFIFNNKEKYLLSFGLSSINFYRDGVLDYFIETSGFTESILKEMKLAQKDDTIIITHKDMAPKELKRTATGWTYKDLELKNIPYFAFNGETSTEKTTGITPSAEEGSMKITADSSIFNESWVGNYIDGNGGRLKITEYVSGTVVNGYTTIPFYTKDKITKWNYISGYEPVWSETRGYPRTCLFAQQRLWFGGARDLPAHIWGSRLADYNNFKNSGNYDNDSIDVTLLTNNPIINIIENRGLQIFTSGEEYASSEDYTPDKIAFTPNTYNGSLANITPALISGTTCYIEKNGKSVLSYVYDYNQASYVSNNLSMFTDLIQNPIAMDVEVNSSNDKGDYIYIVLEDGSCLVACIVLDQNIMSMSKIKTDGIIKDVCCVKDETYFIIERDGYSYIEKLDNTRTDFTQRIYVNSNEIKGLGLYNGKNVYIYGDNYEKEHYVISGVVDLDETLEGNYYIGIPFGYELESMPIDINGKTTTIKKRISKATVLTTDTKKMSFNGQTKSNQNNYEFYACTSYGDDVRFRITGEFYPINVLSITLNLNYEG